MLRPSKYSHPDSTTISVVVLLLARLRKRRIDEFENLRIFAKKSVKGGDILFIPAMHVLYLLGLVEYLPKTDSIEYVGR